MSRLVFDIGGTNMRMAHGADRTIEHLEKIETPASPEDAVEALAAYCRRNAFAPLDAVGGIAGLIEDGVIRAAPNLPGWEGFSFAKELGNALSVPVEIRNDAELAALGEATLGAGVGYTLVAYVGIGTGVGGALIVNGEVAPHARGFEPGHQILDVATGRTFEQLVAGHALEEQFGAPAKDLSHGVFSERTPTLAAGLYNIILEWSPDVMVLGGSLMNDTIGYHLDDVIHEISRIPSPLPEIPPVRYAVLKDESGLYGALVAAL